MAKLSAIKTLTVPFTALLGEETVKGRFRPTALNDDTRRELAKQEKEAEKRQKKGEDVDESATTYSAEIVARLLTEWDVEDDDGTPCPITPEFLSKELGYWGTNLIYNAVLEAMNPGKPGADE